MDLSFNFQSLGWFKGVSLQRVSQSSIRVVAGVFFREVSEAGKAPQFEVLLFQRRLEDPTRPPVWEFPGGKVEVGESDEQALRRELDEELGISVEVLSKIGVARGKSFTSKDIDLHLFLVRGPIDQLELREHLGQKWKNENNIQPEEVSVIERPLLGPVFAHLKASLSKIR